MGSCDHATAIYHHYRKQVWRYLRRQTGSIDDAEDLCQEVFLRVIANSEHFEARGLDRAWVYRIVRRVVIDRKRMAEPETVALDAEPVVEYGTEPVQLLRVSLDEALQRLSSVNRDVLLLRESSGLTPTEIAAATGLTVAAVKNRLGRTRRWLKEVVIWERRAGRPGQRREVTP